jgi:hypothetical protein
MTNALIPHSCVRATIHRSYWRLLQGQQLSEVARLQILYTILAQLAYLPTEYRTSESRVLDYASSSREYK